MGEKKDDGNADLSEMFHRHVDYVLANSVRAPKEGGSYRCPCCGKLTLPERGSYDTCPVCFWEDDGQDDHDADAVRGGPNNVLSLTQARENYRRIGACEPAMLPNVRPPLPEEE